MVYMLLGRRSFQLYINCEINVSPVRFTATSSKLVIWLHSALSSFRQLTCITSRCWWNYNHMFPPQIVSKGARSQENTHALTRAQLPIRGVSNKRERSCFLSVIIDGWWLYRLQTWEGWTMEPKKNLNEVTNRVSMINTHEVFLWGCSKS